MTGTESLMEDRALAYEPTIRVDLKRSGNAGDPHIYVTIGGNTCIAAIWRENETTKLGDFEGIKRVWKSTATPQNVWPSLETALKMSLQEWGNQQAVRERAAEELAYFERNDGRV